MMIDFSVAIIFMIIFVLGVIALIVLSVMNRKKSGLNVEKYRAEWSKIEKSIDNGKAMTYQMAVLSADKLLDQAMKDLGVSGGTMGDRLKSTKSRFSNTDDIWFAHKLRNRIAHESDVSLNLITTKKALSIIKKALKDLGAL